MYKDPFASCDLQKQNRGSFRQNLGIAATGKKSLLAEMNHILPITVPDKRDRLTIIRLPMYIRRTKNALRLAVQPRRASLFHHHIPRLDGEVQASRVDCEREKKERLTTEEMDVPLLIYNETPRRENLCYLPRKRKFNLSDRAIRASG